MLRLAAERDPVAIRELATARFWHMPRARCRPSPIGLKYRLIPPKRRKSRRQKPPAQPGSPWRGSDKQADDFIRLSERPALARRLRKDLGRDRPEAAIPALIPLLDDNLTPSETRSPAVSGLCGCRRLPRSRPRPAAASKLNGARRPTIASRTLKDRWRSQRQALNEPSWCVLFADNPCKRPAWADCSESAGKRYRPLTPSLGEDRDVVDNHA